MDHRYPPDEFAHAKIEVSPSNAGDYQDAKNTHTGGYSARWRDDRQLENNSFIGHDNERSRSARLKDDRVFQHGSSPLIYAKPGKANEQYSDAPSKSKSASILGGTPVLVKQSIDEPPIFQTIRHSLTTMCKEDQIRHAEFEIQWDIDDFLPEELEGQRNLAPVLTLSGTVKKAFAATCEEYIRYFWPEFGLDVLDWLCQIIQKSDYRTNYWELKTEELDLWNLSLPVDRRSSRLALKATGMTESLVKLAQILTWIAATFRRPKCDTLSYSTPTFQKASRDFYIIGLTDLEPIEDGLCWCPMFANGVIAKHFPTPERHDEVGLEIQFDLMVMLGRIWYPLEYMDGFVLKGYSTILVPTLKTQHSVQWHFINNKDQERKIEVSAIKDYCRHLVEDTDLRVLQTARTFIGWTSDAHVHVGAKTSGYDSIRDSKVRYSPRRPRLAREMTSGIGTSGLGFFGVQFGAKVVIPKGIFGPVKREHILLEDMLLNSRNNPLLLWDEGTRRSWMVSEIAVLLMILHVWAARQTDSETLLKKIPFAECSSDDAQASYEAIRTNRNLILRSQANGDGEDLKFMTQVENIFAALESRKEEIITRNNASAMFSYSTYLKGWELMDIAYSKPWFKEKRVLLDDTCGTWPSVIAKRREVLVLFCRGVGDLIQPSTDDSFCQTWRSVPTGHSYLTTTAACIKNLDIYCQLDDRFKACSFNHKICPSRLQELNRRPSSRSISIPPVGAIIVGRFHHSLYQACSPGLGQLQDMTHKLHIEQNSAQKTRQPCIDQNSAQETPKLHIDQTSTQEPRKLTAIENSILPSSLPESINTSETICPSPNNEKTRVQIEGKTRMGENGMNAF